MQSAVNEYYIYNFALMHHSAAFTEMCSMCFGKALEEQKDN